MTGAVAPRDPYALDRETLIVCGVALIGATMTAIDITVVNVALDHLAVEFQTSFTTIQWVVTGYTLALATVVPVTGWAADRFGTKRLYLATLAAFVCGSVLCALAWSAESLIAFRLVQGLGGGMIPVVVSTIVARKAGPKRRGRVMGILGVPLLAAPICGPILGGWLVDDFSWRWLFLINLPIGLVGLALAALVFEPDRPRPAHPLDWLGVGLLSPGLALLIFGFAQSPEHGFAAIEAWLPALVGAIMIVAFLRHSWSAEVPLIDVRTFTHTRAGPGAATFFLIAIGGFGVLLLMPVYFQVVRGTSVLEAGLLLAPQGVGSMLALPVAGWLTDRIGPERLPIWGIPLMVLGVAPFVLLAADASVVLLSLLSVTFGVGLIVALTPTVTAMMNAVPEEQIARTSTATTILDLTGASIGTAILSVLLTGAIASGPLADAFASTFAWAAGILALAFLPALAMERGRRRDARGSGEEGAPGRSVLE